MCMKWGLKLEQKELRHIKLPDQVVLLESGRNFYCQFIIIFLVGNSSCGMGQKR